jgi:hypothetical protein
MKALLLLSMSLVLAGGAAACSVGDGTDTTQDGVGPNGIAPNRFSTGPGWMSSNHEKKTALLYVSDEGNNVIDIFSVPGYMLEGQITKGIDQPEGIATDQKGNLYVSNLANDTVTVYRRGGTRPSLTLSEPDGPDDVAVALNGYVFAGDLDGGVDVYVPGTTSPSSRLPFPGSAYGVGVDSANNVYAAGTGSCGACVIEYANGSGSGTNLGLKDLSDPTGVLIDKEGDIVESDYKANAINVYAPGSKSPRSSISVHTPDRSALDKAENLVFVPQGNGYSVGVLKYPSGSSVTSIPIGNFTTGTALVPAAEP